MTPPHGCGKSQGGDRPEYECASICFTLEPVYFCSGGSWTRPRLREYALRISCLCNLTLPQGWIARQADVTHRRHSLAPLREATRSAVRFDVAAKPPHGLRAVQSVDNAIVNGQIDLGDAPATERW